MVLPVLDTRDSRVRSGMCTVFPQKKIKCVKCFFLRTKCVKYMVGTHINTTTPLCVCEHGHTLVQELWPIGRRVKVRAQLLGD
jgi:hypothetical protein